MATLGSPAPRTAAPSSTLKPRSGNPLKRRAVATVLVIASLALLSVYFRESNGGPVHHIQSAGASVLRPFEVGAERVARPFQDGAHWFGGVLHAHSENARLRAELDRYRQRALQNATAAADAKTLRALLRFETSPSFPLGYHAIATRVIARGPSPFVVKVVVGAGSRQGVTPLAPVVTGDGLAGIVSRVTANTSLITLLTDQTSAASGLDPHTRANGIVRHDDQGDLILDRVSKDQVVNAGDVIVTAGWRSGNLDDVYPRGIPVGTVTKVGQTDTDPFKNVQIEPFVDFSALDSVLILEPPPASR